LSFLKRKTSGKANRIDRPFTLGVAAYSHSEALRVYFSVAWKIERTKVLYTMGERLVKPAAVKRARIMCDGAQTRNQFGTPGGAKSFPRGAQNF